MYKIGEFIVYGNEGVCEVEEISVLNIPGTDKTNNYYTLKPMHGNGTVFVPVNTNMFIRPIITPGEIEKIITNVPEIEENESNVKNAKVLQEQYKKLLSTHQCIDTLTVMKSLCNKKVELIKSGKKLGQIEDKYLRLAQSLLEDEFSVALGISKEEAETYIKDKAMFN